MRFWPTTGHRRCRCHPGPARLLATPCRAGAWFSSQACGMPQNSHMHTQLGQQRVWHWVALPLRAAQQPLLPSRPVLCVVSGSQTCLTKNSFLWQVCIRLLASVTMILNRMASSHHRCALSFTTCLNANHRFQPATDCCVWYNLYRGAVCSKAPLASPTRTGQLLAIHCTVAVNALVTCQAVGN